jgi:hypothetical protein
MGNAPQWLPNLGLSIFLIFQRALLHGLRHVEEGHIRSQMKALVILRAQLLLQPVWHQARLVLFGPLRNLS